MVRKKKFPSQYLIIEIPHCLYAKFCNKNALQFHPIDKIRSISILKLSYKYLN